ncbi:MAG: gamma-glutamylcyclotransferase [Deltaproteobacteria bacterium]|jgi:gamma-glutamylcyclotransferase (GGCT)/AIG2-like uncharacterized protein YtfP|nr:gamma-glutamylcyclotransferase [Deltaproteobacteria bacterium]
MVKTPAMLKLYVYGSLKQGFWNHDHYCRGVVSVREAEVIGRLFKLPSGVPVLEVPPNLVLAEGTLDPRGDALLQKEHAECFGETRVAEPEMPGYMPEYGWGSVRGEIMSFNDPLLRLPHIDTLEGYLQGGSSPYRRLLYPSRHGSRVEPVWLYAAGCDSADMRGEQMPLPSGRWPS